jgi:hypothetical protein
MEGIRLLLLNILTENNCRATVLLGKGYDLLYPIAHQFGFVLVVSYGQTAHSFCHFFLTVRLRN